VVLCSSIFKTPLLLVLYLYLCVRARVIIITIDQ
jgi:hypothetical protein